MKKSLWAFISLAAVSLALAQVSKYKDWPKSPEAYFLTPAEREEWARVKSDEEAEKFIATYWAKRRPGLREDVRRKIAAADEQFRMRRQRGSESVRGRVFITLGSPSRRSQSRPASVGGGAATDPGLGASGTRSPFESDQNQIIETWTYPKDKFDPALGIGDLSVQIVVDPQRGVDELQNPAEVNPVIIKVVAASVVNPGAIASAAAAPSSAPSASAPAGSAPAPAPPAARPAPPSTSAAASAAAAPVAASLPAAVHSSLEVLIKQEKSDATTYWSGAFRTIPGEPFYAFQFYLPADKAPAAPIKFGGVVTNASGQEVASYWEDAPLSDMKTGTRPDKVFEHSVVVPAGSYRGAFGLFPPEGGAALVSASAAFQLEPKKNDFDVSPLILANTLTPLTKRPAPTDPFVFGVEKPIRVEPKANRLFTKNDGLWYFYTVSNPKTPEAAPAAAPTPASPAAPGSPAPPAAAEPKPRVMARIGVLKDGQPAFAPLSGPAELQPLGPGYYASGSEIPLASFEPGYYTLMLNVRDLNSPKDSAAYKGVDRKEDFVVLKPDGSLPEKAAKPAAAAKPKVTPKKS